MPALLLGAYNASEYAVLGLKETFDRETLDFRGKIHLRHSRAVKHAVLTAVLFVTIPAFLRAGDVSDFEGSPALQVEMKGSCLNIYRERLLSNPNH